MVGHAGSPIRIVHVGMTLTRSKVNVKVKVTALLQLRKLHFSRSIFSAILTWNSKLMVDRDSTGPSLQLIGARFWNFLLESHHVSSSFAECRYYTNFKWPYFCTAGGYGHMVGYAICIAHTDVTLN